MMLISSRTLQNLKSQLLPALKPLSAALPIPSSGLPTSTSDYRLWDDKDLIEGAEPGTEKELKCLDEDEAGMKKSIQALGWVRWKTVYVS